MWIWPDLNSRHHEAILSEYVWHSVIVYQVLWSSSQCSVHIQILISVWRRELIKKQELMGCIFLSSIQQCDLGDSVISGESWQIYISEMKQSSLPSSNLCTTSPAVKHINSSRSDLQNAWNFYRMEETLISKNLG